jgi:hypothetical protein
MRNGGRRPDVTYRTRAGDPPNIGQLASGYARLVAASAFAGVTRLWANGPTSVARSGVRVKSSQRIAPDRAVKAPAIHAVRSNRRRPTTLMTLDARLPALGSEPTSVGLGWARGYIPGVTSESAVANELSPSRAWWLRVPATLVSPRSVFFALREDDPDDVAARGEPLLFVTGLAGMAAVLATPTAADLLDNPEYDALLLAVWAFIAGGIYGAAGYFVIGFAVYFGVMLLGSAGGFRRARQTVGFALVPLAASLLVTLPLRLAVYGGDTFRDGGADDGLGGDLLLGLQLGAALALLAAIVGVFAML